MTYCAFTQLDIWQETHVWLRGKSPGRQKPGRASNGSSDNMYAVRYILQICCCPLWCNYSNQRMSSDPTSPASCHCWLLEVYSRLIKSLWRGLHRAIHHIKDAFLYVLVEFSNFWSSNRDLFRRACVNIGSNKAIHDYFSSLRKQLHVIFCYYSDLLRFSPC